MNGLGNIVGVNYMICDKKQQVDGILCLPTEEII